MIYLSATEPNVIVTAYETSFTLEPITPPEVNVDHILGMENALGDRILKRNNGKIQKIHFEADRIPGFPKRLLNPSCVPNGKKVLIIRGGGIGDVLMCTPAIRELRKRLPEDTRVYFATFKTNFDIFKDNPDLDFVLAQPMTLGELLEFDFYFEFNDPDNLIDKMPMIDFYLLKIGSNPSSVADKLPFFSLNGLFDETISNSLRQRNAKYEYTVYLNGLASDKLRDMPFGLLSFMIKKYPKILFIIPKAYTDRYPDANRIILKYKNVFHLDTSRSFGSYATALAESDLILTTDSSAVHLAAALNKPCVCLFGPIDSQLRSSYYPSVIAVDADYQGSTCASPCGKSMFSQFYAGVCVEDQRCPEARMQDVYYSPCMSSFREDKLCHHFECLLEKCNPRYSLLP